MAAMVNGSAPLSASRVADNPRLVELVYKETVHAFREIMNDRLFLSELNEEEKYLWQSIQRCRTRLCDLIDPKRGWSHGHAIEHFWPGAFREKEFAASNEQPEESNDADTALAPIIDLSCWRQSHPRPIKTSPESR